MAGQTLTTKTVTFDGSSLAVLIERDFLFEGFRIENYRVLNGDGNHEIIANDATHGFVFHHGGDFELNSDKAKQKYRSVGATIDSYVLRSKKGYAGFLWERSQ